MMARIEKEENILKKLLPIACSTALLLFTLFGLSAPVYAQQRVPQTYFSHVCTDTGIDVVQCDALLVASANIGRPSGLNPVDLQAAYKLPSWSSGGGQTVAIVDAYDDPSAEADLATYRAQFGLPACTTANGCFHKVGQSGGSKYPKASASWALEISLDTDMVSAICPHCHILLVEAKSASITNLATSVNTAASLGANEISNSYGGDEKRSLAKYAPYYNHPGVIITAGAGDNSFGVSIPAAFNTVVAVGGTTLGRSTTLRGWSETAWPGTGSGCSSFIAKPNWQTDPGCAMRTVSDVAAVADPATGVSFYASYKGAGGWLVAGGTSVSSPIIASVYALAENGRSINAASSLYSHPGSLYDIVSGSDGNCGSYLCTAQRGYDGPTGLGTPNGLGAF